MPKWLPAIILDLHTALPPSTGKTAKVANLSGPECCSVFWAQCLIRSVLWGSYYLFGPQCCYCWNWGRGRVSLRCRSSHCKCSATENALGFHRCQKSSVGAQRYPFKGTRWDCWCTFSQYEAGLCAFNQPADVFSCTSPVTSLIRNTIEALFPSASRFF